MTSNIKYLTMWSTGKNEIHMFIRKTFKVLHKASSCTIRIAGVHIMSSHMWIPTHFEPLNSHARNLWHNKHGITKWILNFQMHQSIQRKQMSRCKPELPSKFSLADSFNGKIKQPTKAD
jgi:hypothetical protein